MATNWVDTLNAPRLVCTNANWNSSFLWRSQHKSQNPRWFFFFCKPSVMLMYLIAESWCLFFFPLAPLQRDNAIFLPNPTLSPSMDGGFCTENSSFPHSPRLGAALGLLILKESDALLEQRLHPWNCSEEELQIRPLADASLSRGLISPGAYDCISRCI